MVSSQILNISIIGSLHVCPKLHCSLPMWGNLPQKVTWCPDEAFVLKNKQAKLLLFGG